MRDDFLQIIHPDDVDAVLLCFHRMIACAVDQTDLTRIRYTLYYRLKNTNGWYLHISDEKFIIESRNGKYLFSKK